VKSLYLRIWLTVLAALSLFALASGWLVQRHLVQERAWFQPLFCSPLCNLENLWKKSSSQALPSTLNK
jgi:ABC-type Fe3+ transport system permease subunit